MNDKVKQYMSALQQLEAVIGPNGYETDLIGKMSITSAILRMHFPDWVFVGFYRRTKPGLLEIGPYQGNLIACGTISFGRGVCGDAAENIKTIIVDDVARYPGYISCDDLTRSEIVVPVLMGSELVAVLDIDGPNISDFDNIDREYLEKICALITA